MKPALFDLTTLPVAGRRRVLTAAVAAASTWPFSAALGATFGAALASTTASASASSFALTSPQRAASFATGVDANVASALVKQATGELTRQPHVMALVRTSGLLDGEGDRNASIQAQEDWRQVRVQAMAYRLTGNSAHLDVAIRYLAAWIPAFSPSFNPIDETELASLLWGIDLLQDALPPALRTAIIAWCGPLARGYLSKKIINGAASTGVNNWHSHRMKIGTAAAFLSGDAELIASAHTEFTLQVLRNIGADGKAFDFTQRDALHYVVYTLEPLLAAALMARAHGQDWYGDAAIDGRLQKALSWLQPYAAGERAHEEFVHSSVAFDKRRADAGVKGYAGPWHVKEAATVYWLAARLDARYAPLSASLDAPPWVRALFV